MQGFDDYRIVIGKGTYISSHSTFESRGLLKIGNHISSGPNLMIVTHPGHLQALSKTKIGSPNYLISKPVAIEDNVYLGGRVIIQMGVTIGKYSVINAGSLVTKSIPSYSFAKGIPAKVVGKVVFDNENPIIKKYNDK